MVESRQKFLTDILYSFLPFTISKLRGILVIPILTKLLGPGSYGVWVQYSITLILLTKIAGLGLQNSMNRYLTQATDNQIKEDYYTVLAVSFSVAIIFSIIIVAFRKTIANALFPTSNGELILFLLAVTVITNIYFVQTLNLLRSQRKIKDMNLWRSVRILGEIGCLLIGGLVLKSILNVLVGIVLLYISISLLLSVRILAEIGFSIPQFQNVRSYLNFGLPLLFSTLAYWIVNTSDRYIITYFLSLEAVGAYSVIYSLATVVGMVSHPVVNVLFPDLSALHEDGATEEFLARFGDVVRYFLLFAVPAVIGLIVLREPTVRFLSTAEISGDADLMILLAPALAAYGLFNIFVQILKTHEKATYVGLLWVTVAVSNISLNLALVPTSGVLGAAIATLLAFSFGVVVAGWTLREELLQVRLNLPKLMFSTAIMGGTVWVLKQQFSLVGGFRLFGLVGTGLVVFVALTYVLGLVSKDELRTLRTLFN
ncbi:hypothetical protein EXE43_07730 [Halorubrum sp. SS5]|nr:hypothetical protein EXE43_07730 [Halorubrum sp. SS5]